MQQLAKSFGSLSWALPLFGLQQMTNALRRSEDGMFGGDAVAAFDAVTRASLEQCGTSVRDTFEAGDKIQRELVDMMCRLVPMGGAQTPETSTRGSCGLGMSGMSDMMNPMQMVRRFAGRPDDAAQPQPHSQQAHSQQAHSQQAHSQQPHSQQPHSQQPHESELGWGPVPPID